MVAALLSVFFDDTATTDIYPLSLHDALPILDAALGARQLGRGRALFGEIREHGVERFLDFVRGLAAGDRDRKSTRLNSSHSQISYAVFCLKKKTKLAQNTHSLSTGFNPKCDA